MLNFLSPGQPRFLWHIVTVLYYLLLRLYSQHLLVTLSVVKLHSTNQVEDSKSTVWVVRVVPHGHKPFPHYPLWNVLAKRLSRIGIQTGTFYCPRHNTWCLRQGWKIVPAMILAMPTKQDNGPKIEVYQVNRYYCNILIL